MKTMNKLIIAACTAMSCWMAAAAAVEVDPGVDRLYCKSGYYDDSWVVMAKNAQGNIQGTLTIYLDNTTQDYNSFQMDFYLPEGFSIVYSSRTGYAVTLNNGNTDDSKTVNHSFTVGDNEGFYRIVCTSLTQTTILDSDDWLLKVTFQAPADFDEGSQAENGEVKNIRFARVGDTSQSFLFPDMSFVLMNENRLSGIEDVMAGADAVYPEGVYDLNGRRLNPDGNLAPGFYIIDGVKTHIK